jgi:3-dehydroquinate synthase II
LSTDRIVLRLPVGPRAGTVLERARRRGFRRFVGPASVRPQPGEEWYTAGPTGLGLRGAGPSGHIPLIEVADPSGLDAVARAWRSRPLVAVRWAGERVLPLETVIARRPAGRSLWVVVDGIDQVPSALGALEHGADRAVVEAAEVGDLDRLEALLDPPPAAVTWQILPVLRVRPMGLGDRVIVDTTSLLAPEEGMLVGSSAAALFHVTSEAEGSRYTRPRAFRVNAGSAHSYALLASGETRYLSELVPGDAVWVGVPGGRARGVRVGRLKIERRPLVLVEVADGRKRYTVFLQEAETVRLSGVRRREASTSIRPGARLRIARLPAGRHLGVPVEETVEER